MKAFFCETENDGTGEVQFWTDDQVPDLENSDYYAIIRKPEFDQYAEQGWVPAQAWIESGGWLECAHCGNQVDPELWNYDLDKPMEPVYVGAWVYCSVACQRAEQERKEQNRQKRQQILDEFRARFPFCEPVVGQFFYVNTGDAIEFTFPGGKGFWDFTKPDYVSVARIYLESWKAAEDANQTSHHNGYLIGGKSSGTPFGEN